MKKISLIFLFTIVSIVIFAQENAGNNWYFGNRCGISFNTGVPVVLSDGILNQQEGVCSISNQQGELLFYSDGRTIWDKTHQAMLNANGDLDGHYSSTQSAIIAPNLMDNTKFYIFTIDELGGSNGLKYSTVDMTLQGNGTSVNPLGDVIVTEKNIPLASPVVEKVTIVLKSNNIDYWLIAHGWGNNTFYVFEVTSSGVNTTPLIFNVGEDFSGNTINTVGYMKSTLSGNKIALVNRTNNHINLFDFNRLTGEISNPENITPSDPLIYGLEFSYDNQYLFIGGETTISKYNLSDQTQVNLDFDDDSIFLPFASAVRALQIAPNGNVYVSVRYNDYLSMIDPSFTFVRSNEVFLDADSTGRYCRFGLPTLFYYKGFEFFTGSVLDTAICYGDSILIHGIFEQNDSVFYDTLQTSLGWDSIVTTNLTFVSPASTPTITESLGVLSSSYATNCQWYLDGNPILGATNQEYIPTETGNYQVAVGNGNGCFSMSDLFYFEYDNINSIENYDIYIYPNPVKNKLVINDEQSIIETVEIFDITGKKVKEVKNDELIIDFSNFKKGFYLLKIKLNDEDLVNYKIIKEYY